MSGTPKTVLKASVSRRYKDRGGNWRSSQSFGRNEIPLVVYCLRKASGKIIEEERAHHGSSDEREEVVV